MAENDQLKNHIAISKAYKFVFSSPEGEKVMDHLKGIASYNTSTILESDKRDLSQWREGRRSLVLDIKSMLDLNIVDFRAKHKNQRKKEDQWLNQF